ncbi:MAG: hypothetical protein COT39_02880 [Parcubacteria group bacterium CG08_land_8_20_14_0_20_48_21]|nr:MAG: hypothetical protein AUK21_02995 [Parcubacteria group bacterium CG2_30_48_51]PIS32776.1 MAG: hypothetical protein COT39_02880 [Parcubacteria group bacterium CG08_land_8_20_14_0_20_48_21]PIW79149.1 MAG: hypothetical protein COZ99_02595 [Parcubacteria group bacterium CG_4_8_14_3_um_filter_48_16]PIY77797.1 MAG: hypothetical protein COY83_03260 [Parcubacteria group bacterium CG_4_10_14_0_8_um_filter_48_154]PIZ77990.1 MAG: hypothetical protein COY03_00850 [bacterium CG_4_10_14_0_2_um_filter_
MFLPIGRHVNFSNKQGDNLAAIFDVARKPLKKDFCLVFLHGYLSEKEGRIGKALANTLPQAGISLFRFDFSGNSESAGEFGEGSFSKMREDARSALAYLQTQGFKKFAVLGHSFGSAVGLTLVSEIKEIKYFIALSGTGDLPASKIRRFSQEALRQAEQVGYTYVQLTSGEKRKVTKDYLEDFDRYDIADYARKARKPALFLWGKHDTTILEAEVRKIYDAYAGQKAFAYLPHADHFFYAQEARQEMTDVLEEWLTRRIRE